MYKLCSAPSFSLQTPISFVNQESLDELKLYPNPTNENIKIITTKNLKYSNITILNESGMNIQKIESESIKNSTIEFSQYNPGLYFIQIQDSTGNKITKKIIKTEQ